MFEEDVGRESFPVDVTIFSNNFEIRKKTKRRTWFPTNLDSDFLWNDCNYNSILMVVLIYRGFLLCNRNLCVGQYLPCLKVRFDYGVMFYLLLSDGQIVMPLIGWRHHRWSKLVIDFVISFCVGTRFSSETRNRWAVVISVRDRCHELRVREISLPVIYVRYRQSIGVLGWEATTTTPWTESDRLIFVYK